MNIKKDFLVSSDTQSFAVSTSNIYVPFVWNVPAHVLNTRKSHISEQQIDSVNARILCLPKNIFDILVSKNMVDLGFVAFDAVDISNPSVIKQIEDTIYRSNLLIEHLATVQIENPEEMNNAAKGMSLFDACRLGKYFVRVESVRVHPYIGKLIPSNELSLKERNAVPKEYGKNQNSSSLKYAIDPSATSSNEIQDLRKALFDDLTNAINGDKNIDQNANGPYFLDINKPISFHCNNQIVLDADKQELAVYTSVDQPPKISYGPGDIYTSKANTRIYGTPIAYYNTNEAENPAQGYQHSTFMTPTPNLISSPLGGLTSQNQDIHAIFKEFGGLLG